MTLSVPTVAGRPNVSLNAAFTPLRVLALSVLAASALMAASAFAQPVFRIVGADGKVTFSDKPPQEAAKGKTAAGAASVTASAGAGPALPFELRQIAAKYPVTLYTGDNCGPCGAARSLLTTRGVPFVEKTITSFEDSQSLQRISGDNGLPFATIGGQQLKGFSDAEYSQYLTAAGYPTASVLPSSYRQPAATPLVVVTKPADAPAAATRPAPARAAAPAAPAPATDNPAGIKF